MVSFFRFFFSVFFVLAGISLANCSDMEALVVKKSSQISHETHFQELSLHQESSIFVPQIREICMPLLEVVSSMHKDHYKFGTIEKNAISFQNWNIFCDSTVSRILMGGDFKEILSLRKEVQRKLRRLETIDCYIPDETMDDYSVYLEGIWEQVAFFDEEARRKLIEVYEKGSSEVKIRKNPKKESFWKEFKHKYIFRNSDDCFSIESPYFSIEAHFLSLK